MQKDITWSSKVERLLPYIFLAPALILMFSIIFYPMLVSLYNSFFEWNLARSFSKIFVGLSNYLRVFQDSAFWIVLSHSLLIMIVTVSVDLVAGLLLARALNTQKMGKRFIISLVLAPYITAPVVIGVMWSLMYDPSYGIINFLLREVIGIINPPAWLASSSTALWSIIIMEIWRSLPFAILVFVAGFASLPDEPYEAALIDGASPWAAFKYITIPLLRPLIVLVTIFQATDSFKMFDLIRVTTGGGPGEATEVVSTYGYKYGLNFFDMGYAMAFSYIIFLITLLFCFRLFSTLQKEVEL